MVENTRCAPAQKLTYITLITMKNTHKKMFDKLKNPSLIHISKG